MAKTLPPKQEKDMYPIVERWLKSQRKCFKVGTNTGLKHGRIDVVGVRDVGGDLSGEIETISVEVKKPRSPFATTTGQALSYRVYANRTYLAEWRPKGFTQEEIEIAGHLGVGLISITRRGCQEVLSSPHYRPITRMNLLLVEKMGLGKCQLCGTFFSTSDTPTANRWAKTHRGNKMNAISKAAAAGKGLMFWNLELGLRKAALKLREGDYDTYERRFFCPDCVNKVLLQLSPSTANEDLWR